MVVEDLTRCPACGILYINHPGLIPTCRELMEARQWQEYLLKSNAELEAQRNTAKAEVERLKELVTDCEALRLMTAERDRYKAALAESCDNMRAEGPYEGMGICPQLQEVTDERDYYKSTLQTLARGKSIESLIAREALEEKP